MTDLTIKMLKKVLNQYQFIKHIESSYEDLICELSDKVKILCDYNFNYVVKDFRNVWQKNHISVITNFSKIQEEVLTDNYIYMIDVHIYFKDEKPIKKRISVKNNDIHSLEEIRAWFYSCSISAIEHFDEKIGIENLQF